MDIEVRPCASVEELRDALNVISHYFGMENRLEDAERFAQVDRARADARRVRRRPDRRRRGRVHVPRCRCRAARRCRRRGSTVVGVLPTHRRRGVLTRDDAARSSRTAARAAMRSRTSGRRRRRSTAGSATGSRRAIGRDAPGARADDVRAAVRAARHGAARRPRGGGDARSRRCTSRCVAQRPGMFSRTQGLVGDATARSTTRAPAGQRPEEPRAARARRQAGGLCDLHGEAGLGGAARARATVDDHRGRSRRRRRRARELWRWLLDFDWTSEFAADLLPLDHELFLLLAEPRRMQFTVDDGVWVRLDRRRRGAVGAHATRATARSCSRSTDALLPENAGRWHVTAGGAERTEADADLRLDVTRRRLGLPGRLRLHGSRASAREPRS